MQASSMGAYRLYDPQTNESYVGFSRNIEGTRKRLRFELKLNACSYKPLQAFYNDRKGELVFEMLEEYTPAAGMSEEETDAHLQAIVLRYKLKLNAKLVQVQI